MASPSTKPLTMLPPIRAPPPTGTGFAGQLPFMISKPHSSVALSVLVVLLLAVLYEGIKVGKARLLHQALTSLSISTSQQLIEDTDQNSSSSDSPQVSRTRLRWFLCHFGQSLLHVAQVVIGYFMMLAVMSYNTWIFFGVVLGSGVGYYLAYPLLSMT
ncbi:probable low affinity copper uptake protein 2 isoform X1 [Phocoena sinus]|uniref:probable low affinity copper uptake protein 2 isoform X1 n=1 Tax=Phocoena sinus TaxID=42100 RepID=UPI0013C4D8A1|nr:probable low affinity copper uptake protein 2 isoform X1 [Phocoena sinus]XP_032491864.1 probable low affinity copper uptake protein 2 isoform X1 [Phocoena sinus]XP_032491865.1 probable low affinity copper uptake protein 2 isoform X1 [Phocoena sinus]XP_032491866.1 probable low affinity copper uptake protein 2 isoform X1 [Phocoena sinus]